MRAHASSTQLHLARGTVFGKHSTRKRTANGRVSLTTTNDNSRACLMPLRAVGHGIRRSCSRRTTRSRDLHALGMPGPPERLHTHQLSSSLSRQIRLPAGLSLTRRACLLGLGPGEAIRRASTWPRLGLPTSRRRLPRRLDTPARRGETPAETPPANAGTCSRRRCRASSRTVRHVGHGCRLCRGG